MPTFDRGDIVRICLNPVSGKEVQGDARPVLVLSPRLFNQLGITMIAPISQGGNLARYAGFAVSLMGTGCETQGVVLVNMVKSLDVNARGAKWIEKAPNCVVEESLEKLMTIFSG